MKNIHISASSEVHESVKIGKSSMIWSRSHIRENVSIGENTTIGEGVYIGPDVKIGKNCKIQNLVQIFGKTTIEDGVFIGPGSIITNDRVPRAVGVMEEKKIEFEDVGSKIKKGASLGAGVIVISPLTVGRWSMAGAGCILTSNVPDHALFIGSPAKQVCWVCKCGFQLSETEKCYFRCNDCSHFYQLTNSGHMEQI